METKRNIKNKKVEEFKEVIRISQVGRYEIDDEEIEIKGDVERSIEETELYSAEYFDAKMVVELYKREVKTQIEVTMESTVEVGRRIWEGGERGIVCLNFASGVSIGGGVMMGAVAQEEDLCRSGNLYMCLDSGVVRDYYERNREIRVDVPYYPEWVSGVYTDNIIYSRDVVFFRDGGENIKPYKMSVITSPAPCIRDMEINLEDMKYIMGIFYKRLRNVLMVAMENGHRVLILGAWGCGAFGNDVGLVSKMFRDVLREFDGVFDRVIFGIYAKDSEDLNYRTFREVFE